MGQFKVLNEAVPIGQVLASDSFPDSLKTRLHEIADIRKFAIDSLELNDTECYTKVYDQKGKAILWVLIATKPYELEAHEWNFPFIGRFPYKGFFDYEKLLEEKKQLDAKNYDTHINEIAAWSTLSWFNDPILSNMLLRPKGSLANLIIHEMTHSTLFVKNNLSFNENLATFIGDVGARKYLTNMYGIESSEYTNYIAIASDRKRMAEHMLRGTTRLDSLFQATPKMETALRDSAKKQLIKTIFHDADTLSFSNKSRYLWLKSIKRLPNNAYFIGFKTYREQQNTFKQEFETEFNNDFKAYLSHLKEKYKK